MTVCEKCGGEMTDHGDERFPDCEDCGFVQYDAFTLEIIREVRAEQAQAKAIFGHIPTYEVWNGCESRTVEGVEEYENIGDYHDYYDFPKNWSDRNE